MRTLGPYLNIGWMFLASVGLGLWVGHWADNRFGTQPWLFIAGAVLGIVVGFYHFIVTVMRQ